MIWQISALLLTAVVVSVLTFRLAWVGFNDVRDQGLEQIAQTVLRHDPSLEASSHLVPSHAQQDLSILEKRWFADDEYLDQFVSQIWSKQGQLLYSSLPEVGPPMQAPGHHIVTWQGQSWRVGMSVCYDLRFGELYRMLAADLLLVPAAFTHTTGQAHWEVLLRARAIENQAYVIASAQGGNHDNGRRTWGHSMVIDPWGQVMAMQAEGPGVVLADLDMARLHSVREQLPALQHRRL